MNNKMKILLLSDLQKMSRSQLCNLYKELKSVHFSVPFIEDKSSKSFYVDKLNSFYRDLEKQQNERYQLIYQQLNIFGGK